MRHKQDLKESYQIKGTTQCSTGGTVVLVCSRISTQIQLKVLAVYLDLLQLDRVPYTDKKIALGL